MSGLSSRLKALLLRSACICVGFAALCRADTVTLATTAVALGANDSTTWGQLGVDAAAIPHTFTATAVSGRTVSGSFATTTGIVAQVSSASSWGPVSGAFAANDMVIWPFDNSANAGTGAVTFTFSPSVFGAGAVVQSHVRGQFTAKVELFNGATSLGFQTLTSDSAGDAIFIGALDTTAANVTKAVFSHFTTASNDNLTNSAGNFAIGTLFVNVAPANYTWSGGVGTYALGTTGWDLGNWVDVNSAIFGKGSDTAATVTISTTVKPSALTFNPTGSGSYVLSSGTIDFNGAAAAISTSANATINSVLTNTSALTKSGAGTLTLGGVNTYAGTTAVSVGTLAVNGTLNAGGGTVTVSSGATLRGNAGTISRAVTVPSGAAIWPGAAVSGSTLAGNEQLTVGALNLTNGKLKVVATQTANQKLIASGTCTLTGATLALGASGNFSNKKYIVLDAGAAIITTTFTSLTTNGVSQAAASIQYLDAGSNPVTPSVSPARFVQITINGSVTPVTIASFDAISEGSGVALSWLCASEFQNAGFHIYRRTPGGSDWQRVNRTLIPGRLTAASPKLYTAYDWEAAGNCEFRLESIDIYGGSESYARTAGPVCIEGSTPAAITVAGLEAAEASVECTLQLRRGEKLSAAFRGTEASPLQGVSGNGRMRLALDATGTLVRAAQVRDAEAVPASAVEYAKPAAPLSVAGTSVVSARWFTSRPGSASVKAAKVEYRAPGVLSIPQAALPAGFDLAHVAIQREGKYLPALALENGALAVFAPGHQDEYTDKDALFLRAISAGTQAGSRQQAAGLFDSPDPVNSASPASVTQAFHDVYFDYYKRPLNFPPWFSGKYLSDGTDRTFSVNVPAVSSGSAVLTVSLWSLTDMGITPDHALQATVNGVPAGQVQWSGGNRMLDLTFSLPPGVLVSGTNTIDLITPVLDGIDSQISFLHALRIDYSQALQAATPLTIVNAAQRSPLYEVTALASPDVWVVDARFPDRAALVPYETRPQADGSYTLRFRGAAGGTGNYLVVPFGKENAPLAITARSIRPAPSGIAYLATGPAQFSTALQPLMAAHSKEGLRSTFIDQEQLFDYYNNGRYGPDGIRNAVRAVRPRYLLLAGRTTYDYLNYSGASVDPLCPSFLVSTSYWSQTVSDSAFGDLGQGFPEIAVGRIPANVPADAANYVARILSSQRQGAGSGAKAQITADVADPNVGDFAAEAKTVETANPEYTWSENFLGVNVSTAADAGASMRAAASGGAPVLVYAGHGNAIVLGGGDAILQVSDVAKWSGSPVFLQATCTANWFVKDENGYRSIAIQGLLQPGGGLSASIGTSTYMSSQPACAFMAKVLQLSGAPGERWGGALLKAQRWAYDQSNGGGPDAAWYSDLTKSENILGDPALPVSTSSTSPAGAVAPAGSF